MSRGSLRVVLTLVATHLGSEDSRQGLFSDGARAPHARYSNPSLDWCELVLAGWKTRMLRTPTQERCIFVSDAAARAQMFVYERFATNGSRCGLTKLTYLLRTRSNFCHHKSTRHFGGVVNAMPCYGVTIVLGIPFGGVCSNHTGVDTFCFHF